MSDNIDPDNLHVEDRGLPLWISLLAIIFLACLTATLTYLVNK